MTLRRWQWGDDVYDVRIVLLHGDSDAAVAWLDRTFGDVRGNIGGFSGAKTLWIERESGCALALWFPERFDPNATYWLSVLAHECFHAAEFVLRERGMVLTSESDEAYAYYIAWMFRNVRRRLLKKL